MRDTLTKLPLKGVGIHASQSGERDETEDYFVSDFAGRFTLKVVTGRYKISAVVVPEGYALDFSEQSVAVGEGAPPEVVFDLKTK